jgi:predicted transcriptional regulator
VIHPFLEENEKILNNKMGNDISKASIKSMQEDFTNKSNYINERLSDFFGPIDGFKYSNSKEVPSLEKYDDPTYRVLSKEKMDAIKEERQVCANLVLSYKDALDGMLQDATFRSKVNQFVNNMKINPDRLNPVSVRLLKSRDNESICNDVLNYYFLKYRVFRLIKDFDPYQKEFEFINSGLEKNKGKYTNLDPQKQEIGKQKYDQLINAKNEHHSFVSRYIDELMNDDLTYPDLEELYAKLNNNKSTARYCQAVYNICDDVETLNNTKDVKNFNFRDLSYDYEICRNVNLSNVNKFSPCTKLKRGTKEETKKFGNKDKIGGLPVLGGTARRTSTEKKKSSSFGSGVRREVPKSLKLNKERKERLERMEQILELRRKKD